MIWNKKEIQRDAVRELSERFGIDLLSASVFCRRGITDPEELRFYLEEDLRFLHNPFLFDEMEDAVDRIIAAKEEGENVLVFGDRDADGITSTVLLVNALRAMGISVSWNLPKGDEPYGLTTEAIDRFAEQDGTLILTVDCGISNLAEIRYAGEKGIDVIVIDHHIAPDELPPAVAVINPKLSDCGYPFRDLAGCGVVSKVVWALRFASTEWYNEPLCLLNARPGNDSVIVEAVKLSNLIEQDRISETFVPGIMSLERTRLFNFLEGMEVIVYDAELQTKLLKQAFGNRVEIGVLDISAEIGKLFPAIAGESLLGIREKSKFARYSGKIPAEIDTFVTLFTSYTFKKEESIFKEYLTDLDLVALGTIADMMPLRNENRILVKQGMKSLAGTRRKGLREILERQNLAGARLATTDIGWQITPLLNATGRLGVPEKAAFLLLSEDEKERKALADEILSLNRERKRLGDEIWERILPQARKSFQESNERLVFLGDPAIHRGITGITASRLVSFFSCPAVVVALLPDKAVGSVRSVRGLSVKGILDPLVDLFIDYGGHDQAAGFSLAKEKYPELVNRIPDVMANMGRPVQTEEVIEIDAEVPLDYLSPGLIDLVELFEPYGEDNQPLIFLSRGMRIVSLELVGKTEKQHVRMLLDSGKFKWPGVFWNAAARANKDFRVGDTVDVVFRLGRNYFQNKEILQLTVLDIGR